MNKRARQYIGLLSAVAAYYLIHEGAHLLCAWGMGVFKAIHVMGLGVQIDVHAQQMTQVQMGVFCAVGSAASLAAAYVLTALIGKIVKIPSKVVKACAYYITLALLLIDPLYLSVLCGFFGGGDMNGIALLVPQTAARIAYGLILAVNAAVFVRIVLPGYKRAFEKE